MIATSRARLWRRSLLLGLWHRAALQLGVDDVAGAVRSYHDAHNLARSLGSESMEAIVMRMTNLHLHNMAVGAARTCMAAAIECSPRAPLDVHAVSNPLLRAKVHVVSDQIADAVREMLSMPTDWLDCISDKNLTEWRQQSC